jgi:hypothetical protein
MAEQPRRAFAPEFDHAVNVGDNDGLILHVVCSFRLSGESFV